MSARIQLACDLGAKIQLASALGAKINSSFGKTSQGAGKQLTTLNTFLAGLQKHQKNIGSSVRSKS